jgi:ATP-dependent DNA helicase PIF1
MYGSILFFKKNERTDEILYRFNYPFIFYTESAVGILFNRKYLRFFPIRNNTRLNNYNRLFTVSWLVNTDIIFYTGLRAVIEYISKYCIKIEKKSETYRQIIKVFLSKLNIITPLLSFVKKIMNKLIGERD